jgi:hypothetical protein
MPNILINPNSGIMEFSTGVAGGSSFIPNLNFTGGSSYSARLTHDNFGGLNIVSYTTGSGIAYSGVERFSIDGNNGRLFSVTDNLSGSLFSVNDIAGLPIIEAFDDNTVIMGAFNRNDFILTGNSLGIGGPPNTGTSKLYVSGNTTLQGNLTTSGSGIFTSGLDLNNSKLINAVPEFINETTNFLISGNDNGRIILANSANQITGTIVSGNAIGFNTSIIQIGAGQIQITGAGIGITINEYANQYRTAGAFAAVTLLHTGTNGYVMYGNTAS